ncbi:MAG: DUF1599 domain-containing protein [Bacteroidales bacterium]|nr:DUF1599 domain-containing protein [Bacteroidales bacterium]
MGKTEQQFDKVIGFCSEIFFKKYADYGTAWRIMRPESITDQLFIKAQRIRSIEEKGSSKIDEDISSEFIAIVNYGIIGLIQLELNKNKAEVIELELDTLKNLYYNFANAAKTLMLDKNHDYGEAWRSMRISSYTDLILMKLHRTKQIEDNKGKTIISEGIDANYFDMINYAVFALIKLRLEK